MCTNGIQYGSLYFEDTGENERHAKPTTGMAWINEKAHTDILLSDDHVVLFAERSALPYSFALTMPSTAPCAPPFSEK